MTLPDDTTLTITPAALKRAATELRGAERETLGQALAQTTILNILARAAGFASHSHLMAGSGSVRPATGTTRERGPDRERDPDYLVQLCATVGWRTDADRHPVFQHIDTLALDGWEIEGLEPAHGIHMALAIRTARVSPDFGLAEAATRDETRQAGSALADLLARANPGLPAAAFVMPEICGHPDQPVLHVNFMYASTGQVCTANVSRTSWSNRATYGLTDEEALLILAGDCEIPTSIDESDIAVQDVMTEMPEFCAD